MPADGEFLAPIKIRTTRQLLQDLAQTSSRDLVRDPLLLKAAGRAVQWRRGQNVRTLENCGTVAVYWRIGGLPSAGSFGGVLKAGLANDDGNGGFVDLSRVPGDIYIAPTTGSTCRVVVNVSESVETDAV